jgi:diguanylate cyclase (GGDEF)-like protein
MGPLTDIVQDFGLRHSGRMKIVRTGGLIVSECDVTPLSTRINEELVGLLQQKEMGAKFVTTNEGNQLIAFSPIQTTMGSERIGFGGKQESIDQIKGNKGESWQVVISLEEKEALETAHKTTRLIISAGIIFTILTTVLALLLGKWAAKPIVGLAVTAKKIGDGQLNARTDVSSNDEIGSLAKSLNSMADNLHKIMTSKEELTNEVEQRKNAEEKLQILATTDELTGCYNRRAFNDCLQENFGRAKRYNEPLSLLLFDIDHFKKVNDTHGHDTGDLILKAFVCVVMENIRHIDILSRWGGEEFMVLLPQTGKDTALQLAERLREKVFAHDFPKVGHITASIGLTELHADDTTDSMVKRADDALYKAKHGGRNMVIFC